GGDRRPRILKHHRLGPFRPVAIFGIGFNHWRTTRTHERPHPVFFVGAPGVRSMLRMELRTGRKGESVPAPGSIGSKVQVIDGPRSRASGKLVRIVGEVLEGGPRCHGSPVPDERDLYRNSTGGRP